MANSEKGHTLKGWVKWLAKQEGLDRTILIICIAFLIALFIVRNRLEHIGSGGVKLGSNQTQVLYFELENSYHDVYGDIKLEYERSSAELKRLYLAEFTRYVASIDSIDSNCKSSYILAYGFLIDHSLNTSVKHVTITSAFRNHFPPLENETQVREHTEYIARSCLYVSQSDVEEMWGELFPLLSRLDYSKHLDSANTNKKAIKIKASHLITQF